MISTYGKEKLYMNRGFYNKNFNLNTNLQKIAEKFLVQGSYTIRSTSMVGEVF